MKNDVGDVGLPRAKKELKQGRSFLIPADCHKAVKILTNVCLQSL